MIRIAHGLPASEYRASPGVSASGLFALAESPADYRERLANPRPSTPAQALGTLVHLALLEPDRWEDSVAIAPKVNRRTKAGKAQWAAWLERSAGKIVATQDDRDATCRIIEAVDRDPAARSLIATDGESELSIWWEVDGTLCKARVDRLRHDGFLVDVKTASDANPKRWRDEAHRYGYHRQAAHYLDGLRSVATLGETPAPIGWAWLVVQTSAPWHVVVVVPSEQWLDIGRADRDRLLDVYRACEASGEWPGHAGVHHLDAPRWALTATNQ